MARAGPFVPSSPGPPGVRFPGAAPAPQAQPLARVAILGNHLPRQCGIATFTTDLCHAMGTSAPALDCFVVAMNDAGHAHAYPEAVRFAIDAPDSASYRRAVDFLNVSMVDAVSLQHEYGIFGGRSGQLILPLLRELRMPVVTTLHTILAAPDLSQRRVMDEIVARSERLVVMSAHGASLLQSVHHVPTNRIDLIPHGIPEVMFAPGDKDRLGVAGKQVLLTFGLLSPDKGIEHVIDALPAILAAHPETVYLVLGATHPHVLEAHGEAYRFMLESRARRLGVDDAMIFHNRFVTQAELGEFLTAADIYITPYLNPEQSTSGTLAYAVGAGKAVISTPYRYATELLAGDRGILVPPRDADAIAQAVIGLLNDPVGSRAMRQRATAHGHAMRWSAVAAQHVASLTRAASDRTRRRQQDFRARTLAERPASLPELSLAHLQRMTDDTGMLQHARFSVPRYDDGYCIDDNARALMLMALLEEDGVPDQPTIGRLASRYLAFVSHALDADTGRVRNFLTYDRRWAELQGSDDSHGRTVWALGTVVGHAGDPGRRSLAGDLFQTALPAVMTLTSPRAWAYALLGVDEYLRAFEGDRVVQERRDALAERLLDLFVRTSSPDWPWFEASLTYGNARLPQALLVAGDRMGRPDMVAVATRALDWLSTVQHTADGCFAPIGSNGFHTRGGVAARFDQQPLEACGMVAACLQARRITGQPRWLGLAESAFSWFTGQNHLQISVCDPASGGCRDGLHADRVNENQGAESTLSYLQALRDLRTADRTDPV